MIQCSVHINNTSRNRRYNLSLGQYLVTSSHVFFHFIAIFQQLAFLTSYSQLLVASYQQPTFFHLVASYQQSTFISFRSQLLLAIFSYFQYHYFKKCRQLLTLSFLCFKPGSICCKSDITKMILSINCIKLPSICTVCHVRARKKHDAQ